MNMTTFEKALLNVLQGIKKDLDIIASDKEVKVDGKSFARSIASSQRANQKEHYRGVALNTHDFH